MIIENVTLYGPDHRFAPGSLTIREGRICSPGTVPEAGEEIVDGGGACALPGLVDIHLHGAAGRDFCDGDGEALHAIAGFQARRGVLAVCPATMTLPEETLSRIMDTAAAHRNGRGADLVGICLEGPFLSPRRAGAQDPAYLRPPDAGLFRRLQERSGGLIRLVCVAPEVPGAMAFLRDCRGEVRISLAHTCADYDTARAAFASGIGHVTHLFNAMEGIGHRAPGPVVAALEAGAEAELIADGVHVHPAMVRFAFAAFGPGRILLISDSMRACGLPDGQYSLGGQDVTVRGPKAVLTAHPETIAGSVTDLYECMRRAVLDMGVPLERAVRAAGEDPARSIGVDADYGSLAPGRYGNVVLADPRTLEIRRVFRRGEALM